jgi:hypothetical protein
MARQVAAAAIAPGTMRGRADAAHAHVGQKTRERQNLLGMSQGRLAELWA